MRKRNIEKSSSDFVEEWLSFVNRHLPDYNPLSITDWNKVKKLIIDSSGMPERLAYQVATDYHEYRTSVIGWNVLCENTHSRLKAYEI